MSKQSKILLAGLIITICVVRIEAEQPVSQESRVLLKTFMSEFIEVTPGTGKFPKSFLMGGDAKYPHEQKPHKVELKERFWMAKFEVAQNLYSAVTGSNPSRWKGPRNSAEMMTHPEAVQFCQKLTQLLRDEKLITMTQTVRLPTEAEWEYCCRAGTQTAYSFGENAQSPADKENKATLLDPFAWHTGNAAGNDPPVGALKPNPWGFYDMHGYLWEFCAEKWTTALPQDSKTQPQFVIRGGSWEDSYPKLRSAARKPFGADARSPAVGIRCVLSSVEADE